VTPLVLIPGFMCDARLFGAQIKALGEGRMVTAIVPRQSTIPAMAAAILAAVPGRICLGGLSMGGIVALEMLRQAPGRIERLALMDTTPLADADGNHAIRTRQIADVHAGRLIEVMREELKPAYLVESPRKPALLELCSDMAQSLGPDVFEAQSLALRDRTDLRSALALAPKHTLILHGAADRLCPPERHELMHRLAPHATRIVIDRAGHLPTLEQPKPTTAALTAWLGH
jgi:pimeloyl-ACP methyl ester carboxylesterase